MFLIEQSGLVITEKAYMQLSPERAAAFYAEHRDKSFFPALTTFMTSGPIWVLVLAGVDAIASWRTLMGPTDSDAARSMAPDSIRARFGTNKTFNACHGSDSPASASREIRFYFPETITDPLPSANDVAAYVRKHLAPSLLPALTKLCKEKPSTDRNECITWLGQYLLETSSNSRGRAITEAELAAMGVIEDEVDLSDPFDSSDDDGEADGVTMSEQAVDAAVPAPTPTAASVAEHAAGDASSAAAISRLERVEGDLDLGDTLDDMELQLAATRVQSSFRGFQARKKVAKMKLEQKENEAATKLQATYRGHRVRKQQKQQLATEPETKEEEVAESTAAVAVAEESVTTEGEDATTAAEPTEVAASAHAEPAMAEEAEATS